MVTFIVYKMLCTGVNFVLLHYQAYGKPKTVSCSHLLSPQGPNKSCVNFPRGQHYIKFYILINKIVIFFGKMYK